METITYNQVQELVKKLPETKLEHVYSMLLELTEQETKSDSPQFDFMKLPLSQRRKLMRKQAKQMTAHYQKTASEREEWQGGDFIEEY
ncbi:MAG: hypothetical protein GY940_23795 [bacterium]|nr:hypothetical protein [bacterium]